MPDFDVYLGRVSGGESLAMDEMTAVIDSIMRGETDEQRIAMLLTALHHKGESVEEVAGAAAALRKHMTCIPTRRTDLLDTCGTGGDGSGTFNISTAAAIVAAAAGAAVAKHGNRRITSKSGSADVLIELGVNVEAPVETVGRCLDEVGLCFCFAPGLHPAMKHVAPVRRALGFPTIFNLLGPLANPACAPYQLVGAGKPELQDLLAGALRLLGGERSIVVCGEDGLDEVSLFAPTRAIEAKSGQLGEFTWTPEDFGLATSRDGRDSLTAETPPESAALVRRVLEGEPGPPRDIVILNAAAALWTLGRDNSPAACAQAAAASIDNGAAKAKMDRWAKISRGA
ncbi:MAG: anthranilate phosphoribosyltransferase [Planctomycetes bacterium]|nr:anthranilate phosphoribosyltransferase [Planctomycetota bacterium]